jgi:pyruvate kinase
MNYDSAPYRIFLQVKTKIVCTMGPATESEEVLSQMIEAGMDCVRLNFSHSSHDYHKTIFDRVRRLGEKYDNQVWRFIS